LITVRIRKDSRGRLSSFLATGHAGWASNGNDVVCAAVSTVLQTAWLGLDEVAKVRVAGSRRSSRIELSWPEASRSRPLVRGIVQSAGRALDYLALQFPDHIHLTNEAEPRPTQRRKAAP
jgi:uncharacterized protein YsxB (DUF464 family)